MQSITFALPTVTRTQMPPSEQVDILVNQATAAIVCCYLEHMNAAINKGILGATQAITFDAGQGPVTIGFISTPELVSLIDNVQGALRT